MWVGSWFEAVVERFALGGDGGGRGLRKLLGRL